MSPERSQVSTNTSSPAARWVSSDLHVVHVHLSPHPDRVRPGGHPQVHPAAVQLGVLAGDRLLVRLAMRFGAANQW
ncbi:MAG TPA: hypothetical protein VGD71_10235 [Kribbella sp.]